MKTWVLEIAISEASVSEHDFPIVIYFFRGLDVADCDQKAVCHAKRDDLLAGAISGRGGLQMTSEYTIESTQK